MDTAQGPKTKCGAEAAARPKAEPLDLQQVRDRLSKTRGPEFWRSLDELAETPEFKDMLHREFPRHASEWKDDASGVSRRNFLQLAGGSLALAGLTACTRQPIESIVPYVEKPEGIVPGRPLFFATTLTLGGYARGVLAESHEGRPTKVEGNPEHPASLGASDVFSQAAILDLYDPNRSQMVVHFDRVDSWSSFVGALGPVLDKAKAQNGDGLRLLTGTVTSPTFGALAADVLKTYPQARWHRWEAAGNHGARAGVQRALGRPADVRYDLAKAKVVVTLDSDFLSTGPGALRYARDFADGRRVRVDHLEMNRLYSVESVPTGTGALADHRLILKPAEVELFLVALAQAVGAAGSGADALADATAKHWVDVVAQDLKANAGSSLVIVDDGASPAAHALALSVNQALKNIGSTVLVSDPIEVDPVDHVQSLSELIADMKAGKVSVLLMLEGVNPLYTAPVDLGFAEAFEKVPLRIHHGLYTDETAAHCHWHVPAAHELESWGDARAYDGTVSLMQPLIEPLYQGKTSLEMLAVLVGRTEVSPYELVRDTWSSRLNANAAPTGALPGGGIDVPLRKIIHDGWVPNSAAPTGAGSVGGGIADAAMAEIRQAAQLANGQITLVMRPDPTVWDGRYAGNAWLQELPKPLTKLTWDNALVLSPATAQRLKLGLEERVQVTAGGRKVEAAVWILPGQANDTAVLTLGGGRKHAGPIGNETGFNAYLLRTSTALDRTAVTIASLGGIYTLACTQNHHILDRGDQTKELDLAAQEEAARGILRTGTLEEFRKNPDFAHATVEAPAQDMTLYPNRKYEGHRWGMAIDLNVCSGCSACVVACQAENNIPTVGKDQVTRGREMHWLRIDRYFEGGLDNPRVHHQPVPCMQCENAPCEVVCPVGATMHSDEGLNDMVYNRCVGTRYCSNNCPYKVRRFNFLRYSEKESPVLAMAQNPDVTVRMRGVMEKCTYCVQRIEHAKIDSKVNGKTIPDGVLKTACQQACPTQAIIFGDMNDSSAAVVKMKADPLNYGMLEDLNTRPRTTYLAKLRNPNPLLDGAERT
jgi:MoCo/4Fe-4S cofactor protein with predicted Tat translocation signal